MAMATETPTADPDVQAATKEPDAKEPRQPNPLLKETVAIPKSQGRVKWSVPVLKSDEELRRDSDLETVVSDIVEHYEHLSHLGELALRVYWKKVGRTSKGKPNLGGVLSPGPWYEVHGGHCDFILWLAADHIADQGFSGFQLEALLYRFLCSIDRNEEGQTTVKGPDFAGYIPEIEAYGLWHGELKAAGETFRQPRLFES